VRTHSIDQKTIKTILMLQKISISNVFLLNLVFIKESSKKASWFSQIN